MLELAVERHGTGIRSLTTEPIDGWTVAWHQLSQNDRVRSHAATLALSG